MRKTYKLTEQQHAALLSAMQPVPYMIVGGMAPRSQQENANDAWMTLGLELGFDGMTVRPGASQMEFSAEELPPKDPK